jgi:hypothetical protein
MEYARYISHEFAEVANEAFREWVQEQYDPGLKMDRAVALYYKMGKDNEWIRKRFEGIGPRKALCQTIKERNGAIVPARSRPEHRSAVSLASSQNVTLSGCFRLVKSGQRTSSSIGRPALSRHRHFDLGVHRCCRKIRLPATRGDYSKNRTLTVLKSNPEANMLA